MTRGASEKNEKPGPRGPPEASARLFSSAFATAHHQDRQRHAKSSRRPPRPGRSVRPERNGLSTTVFCYDGLNIRPFVYVFCSPLVAHAHREGVVARLGSAGSSAPRRLARDLEVLAVDRHLADPGFGRPVDPDVRVRDARLEPDDFQERRVDLAVYAKVAVSRLPARSAARTSTMCSFAPVFREQACTRTGT